MAHGGGLDKQLQRRAGPHHQHRANNNYTTKKTLEDARIMSTLTVLVLIYIALVYSAFTTFRPPVPNPLDIPDDSGTDPHNPPVCTSVLFVSSPQSVPGV